MLETSIEPNAFDNRFAGDNKLYVVFHMRAVQNGFRSEQEGRPIFDDLPYIRIHVPGDKTTIIEEPVNEEHKQRFPVQWEKFQKGMTQSPEGTPLEQWPILTVGQVMELKALNVMTVEQLAGMSDTNAQRFMGGHELRRKANTFLKVSKDTAEAQRLVTENAELKERIGKQEDTLKQLAIRLEAMEEKAARKKAA